ncbi:MAG: hypothetical protein KA265_15760 [Piscinibacter sp.]|nr:hypothetical protein [Piscinibacter sp.]
MPTSSYTKVQDYAEQLNKGVHIWSSHTFKLALSASAIAATVAQLSGVTQISTAGGYTTGGYTLDTVTLTETSGTAKLTIADEVITASGASMDAFRYLYGYNDSATSPADAGFAIWDYGSNLTLADTETLTVDFDGTNGVWQFA